MRGVGIALDTDFDVKIVPQRGADGKITQGLILMETLPQNQAIILAAQAGELKETPNMGVGIANMLLDSDWLIWRRLIQLQMQLDGQNVNAINLKNGNITIDANY